MKVDGSDLERHMMLPFSTLADITRITQEVAEDLSTVRRGETAAELKLAEVQSNMLKCELLVEGEVEEKLMDSFSSFSGHESRTGGKILEG